jgi:hypothetical protein
MVVLTNAYGTWAIEEGNVLEIGWSAPGGDRGPGATHSTEMVAAILPGALVLVGGDYGGGKAFRVLKLQTTKGPTTQIRGIVC